MPFETGARVRTRAQVPEGHTRLPKYLERRDGRIVRSLGAYPFADERATNASTARKEALYTVEFSEGSHTVCADLFEPYLEEME